jgi:hypothetical protein
MTPNAKSITATIRGATSVDYSILLTMIAMLAITVLPATGGSLARQYCHAAVRLALAGGGTDEATQMAMGDFEDDGSNRRNRSRPRGGVFEAKIRKCMHPSLAQPSPSSGGPRSGGGFGGPP